MKLVINFCKPRPPPRLPSPFPQRLVIRRDTDSTRVVPSHVRDRDAVARVARGPVMVPIFRENLKIFREFPIFKKFRPPPPNFGRPILVPQWIAFFVENLTIWKFFPRLVDPQRIHNKLSAGICECCENAKFCQKFATLAGGLAPHNFIENKFDAHGKPSTGWPRERVCGAGPHHVRDTRPGV